MLERTRVPATLLAIALIACSAPVAVQAEATGAVELQSVGALETGPAGVLFVADSEGAAVYALRVESPAGAPAEPIATIEGLDEKIAAMLGTRPRDVLVKDMAVDEGSGTVYLSIQRGRGEDAVPVILRIAADGEISELALNEIRHSKLELDNAPAAGKMMYRTPARTLTVTDMEFLDGELYIAGLSNEEFASTLRRARFPFDDNVAVTGLEIYHGAHGEYETFAPIYSFMPYEIEGEEHLLAGYLCTPLVTFPIDEIRSKSQLRGKTLAELGWGNIPLDMLQYEKGGESFVLISNNRRGTMKLRAADLAAAQRGEGIQTEVGPRSGVDYHTVPLGHVVQVDRWSDHYILVLSRDLESGSLTLAPRSTRWL